MVTINFQLTKEDYFNFYYYVVWLSPGKRTKAIKKRVNAFLFFSFLLLLVKFASAERTIDSFFFVSILLLACIFLVPLFSSRYDSKRQAFAFIQDPLNGNWLAETNITFSADGISSKDMFAEVKYKWISIVKKEETKDYYFLYTSAVQAIILPKRNLRSEIEKEQLEKLFAEHISFHAEVGRLLKS